MAHRKTAQGIALRFFAAFRQIRSSVPKAEDVFGGQVGVAGHITIADNTSFGAQSGVLGSIRKGGQAFLGTPAIPYRDYLKCYAVFKKAGSEK